MTPRAARSVLGTYSAREIVPHLPIEIQPPTEGTPIRRQDAARVPPATGERRKKIAAADLDRVPRVVGGPVANPASSVGAVACMQCSHAVLANVALCNTGLAPLPQSQQLVRVPKGHRHSPQHQADPSEARAHTWFSPPPATDVKLWPPSIVTGTAESVRDPMLS